MRVGILTFHQTTNYGAHLQAYALWKKINSLGHAVEIINYAPIRSTVEYLKCTVKSKTPIARASQYYKLMRFLPQEARLSPVIFRTAKSLRNHSHSYDLVICGSDEIWNIEKPFIGFDLSYFLDFLDQSTMKASYAASFGDVKDITRYKSKLVKLFSAFDSIAVRDNNSLRLVSECGRQAVKVLDPTFLTDYKEFESETPHPKKYLLVYAYQLNQAELNFIYEVAKQKNLSIISVGNNIKNSDVNLLAASPREWINAFKHASYVITSYYHGLIFSLLYQKSFNVLMKSNKLLKMNDLLDDMALTSRIFDSSLPSQLQGTEIPYEFTLPKIQERKIISNDYLSQILKLKIFSPVT